MIGYGTFYLAFCPLYVYITHRSQYFFSFKHSLKFSFLVTHTLEIQIYPKPFSYRGIVSEFTDTLPNLFGRKNYVPFEAEALCHFITNIGKI